MNFAFKHAWREIRHNRAFCVFYLVNLSLGLLGFITIDSFKRSVNQQVSFESQKLLGADLALRTRREFSAEELKQAQNLLPPETLSVEAVDFFSMVAGPSGRSRLVKVVSMAPGFPFHGSFDLNLKGKVKDFNNLLLHQKPIAWIYPELRTQLDLDLGDQITLGKTKFRISDIVKEDAGLQFQPAEFAPKVFISYNFLEETALLKEGNTAFRNQLYQLPDGINAQILAEKNWENDQLPRYTSLFSSKSGASSRSSTSLSFRFPGSCLLGRPVPSLPWEWLLIPWIPDQKN